MPLRLVLFLLLLSACHSSTPWPQYKGSNAGIHYSALAQIDTNNVASLSPAWEYHTADIDTSKRSEIQCNPIIVDDILYGTSPKLKLFALEASSGREIWRFDPFDQQGKKSNVAVNSSRGVTYYKGQGVQRIFYTAGSNLFAIDAKKGKPDSSFGNAGKIDLHEGLGRDVKDLFVTSTSPPLVAGDLLVVSTLR